jgi:CubicO group peptidase (beta-lactamase class C family)
MAQLLKFRQINKNRIHFIFLLPFLLNSFAISAQQKRDIAHFISSLDTIRIKLKIPGMAAAVMEGDSILFAKGFGYADLKNHIRATENTTFRVASVTKTFTSTLIMQLVEEGKLDLNSPISKYGVDLGNKSITVKNLLTHTSEGEPGSYFQYNGYRYGKLTDIIESAAGAPLYALLMERIIRPTGMSSSAPGISLVDYYDYMQKQKDMRPFFERTFTRIAKPYRLDGNGQITETKYFDEFGAFGGLATCVKDLLKYSAAIDKHQFVSAKTQQIIFTSNRTKSGTITPYGLGWFSQNYKGLDYYWHYGQTQGESAIFIKVPSEKLTFVVLANTEMLSQPFPLGDGDLFTSPLGQLFFKYFINTGKDFQLIDYNRSLESLQDVFSNIAGNSEKDFYNKEIVTQAVMSKVSGDATKSAQLFQLYGKINFQHLSQLPDAPILSALKNISINQDTSQNFSIAVPTKIKIYGVGENCSADFSSWCDYGWIEDSTGKIIWQMQNQPTKHAGGAIKNQKIEAAILLQPGTYKLRYKSDWGHAFNSWDSAPPDNFFWGIILFKD